ncbi:MAG: hypothetical protein ACW99Q_17700 [Candidatus Kariarchaeaceae archaeon]|jgi:hypothetical protein
MATLRSTAVIAYFLFVLLLFLEGIDSINLKFFAITPLIFHLIVSIVYFWEPHVLTNHYSIFKYISSFTLILEGATLAGVMLYLMMGTKNFWQRFTLTLFLAPIIIGIPFLYYIGDVAFDKAPEIGAVHQPSDSLIFPYNYILPLFGEGSEGAIIILSVIFSFYVGIRFLDPNIRYLFRLDELITRIKKKINNNIEDISADAKVQFNLSLKATFYGILIFLIEIITSFAAISAAFSISGIIINDGTPPLESVSRGFVLFTFLTTIPFILLISRRSLFGQPKNYEIES